MRVHSLGNQSFLLIVALVFGLILLGGSETSAAQEQTKGCDDARQQLEKLCNECGDLMVNFGVDCAKVRSRLSCLAEVPPTHWRGEYYVNGKLEMIRDDGQIPPYYSGQDERLDVEFGYGPTNQFCFSSLLNGTVKWTKTVRSKGGQCHFRITEPMYKLPFPKDSPRVLIDGVERWVGKRSTSSVQRVQEFDLDLSEGTHMIQVEYEWDSSFSDGAFRMTYHGAGVFNPGVPPLPPAVLTATAFPSYAIVKLTWRDSSTVEDEFEIERRSGTGDWVLLRTLAANSTSFDDKDSLESGTTYEYRVRATNLTGASEYSNTASLTTGTAPAAPQAFARATTRPNGYIDHVYLSWTHESECLEFELERRVDESSWTLLDHITNSGLQYGDYHDVTVGSASKLEYRVRGSNEWGVSEWSNVAIVTIPTEPEPSCPPCPECPVPEPCPNCPECKPCPDCPECKPCPKCEVCPEPTPCPACPPCPDVPAPPPSPTNWKSVIQSGQTFYVSLDEPAAGNSWMGSLKANETYTVVYTRSTNTFRATGDARDGRTNRTGQYRNANLDNQEISVWGRLFTFDNAGQVFDKEYGVLVGHLSEYPVTPNSDSLSSALANPGAEEGTRYWEISAAIVAKTEHATLGPQSGKYFFSTTGKAAASAKMQQEIDISGCRVLTLSGYFATDSSDQARVTIALFDAAGKPTKTALVRDLGISRARWKVFEIQESAPSNSAVAKITLEGIKGPSGGQTDVHFDGMSVSCSK